MLAEQPTATAPHVIAAAIIGVTCEDYIDASRTLARYPFPAAPPNCGEGTAFRGWAQKRML
jgi:hypothetical protein